MKALVETAGHTLANNSMRIFRQLEERRRIASGLLIVVALGCFAATLKISGPELSWDSMDYAQCARQVARGGGYTSKLLVGEITDGAFSDRNPTEPWRNTFRPPMPVYAMAASFRLFGETDRAVCYWAGLFYIATCWLMFATFSPAFGFTTAFLSALVFAVSRCGLIYARAGLTESAAMFFLVLAFALLQKHVNFLRGVLVGAVFAISSLNRPIALVWALGAAIAIALYEREGGRRLAAAGGIAAGAAAILVLSRFTLGWTYGRASFAVNLAYGVGDPHEAITAPLAFVPSHPVRFAAKVVQQLGRPLVYLFQFGGISILSGLAPFGLLLCLNGSQRRGRTVILAMLICNALCLSVLMSGDAFAGPLRYFDVFAPLALPWAVQLLLRFSNELSGQLKSGFWCLVALALAGSAWQSIRDPFPTVRHPEIYAFLHKAVAEDEVIAASEAAIPPAVAWYSDRRTVFLQPDSVDIAEKLRGQGLRIDWFITTSDEPQPAGFHVARTWPSGRVLWHHSGDPK